MYLEVQSILELLIILIQSNILQGVPRDYVDIMKVAWSEFEKIIEGSFDGVDWDKMKPFYACIAKDIDTHKKRIGGDFAIAQAVTSREMRDHIRITLPDCVFITMSLTKENQIKRVKERHGDDPGALEFLAKMFDFYEGPGEGEKNTFNIDITEDMSPKDVMDKVLEILDKNPAGEPPKVSTYLFNLW